MIYSNKNKNWKAHSDEKDQKTSKLYRDHRQSSKDITRAI